MQKVHDFLKNAETYYLATVEDDGNTVVYYLNNAKATFSSFTTPAENIEF